MNLVKPDKETALKYDFMLLEKNGVDWKSSYRRRLMIDENEIIEQGDMDDFEFYKKTHTPLFQYYLIEDDGTIIGRAIISKRGESIIDIQYVKIEKDMQHKGYGKKMFALIDKDLLSNSKISGIFIEDKSKNGETSAIAKALGYIATSGKSFFKANPNYKKRNTNIDLDEAMEL